MTCCWSSTPRPAAGCGREAIRRHLGARLTADQCRELAALLEQAVAGTDIGMPGKAGR